MFSKKNNFPFMIKYLKELIYINCPLCNQDNTTLVGTGSRGGLKIKSVICNSCSLIYLNPKPTPKTYTEFYAIGDYRRFLNIVKKKVSSDNIDNFLSDEKFNKRKQDGKKIASIYFSEILSDKDLFFDFGCDTGGILAGVQEECNCNIMGNEPSQPCANYIKDKLGIHILNCTMENIKGKDKDRFKGKVKLASIIGTLEHVNNPVSCLKIAYDMLQDNGYLYIESFDILKRIEIKKECMDDAATIDHQYYFHKDVYEYMLALNNFEIIKFHSMGSSGRMMNVLAIKRKSLNQNIKYSPENIIQKVKDFNEHSNEHKKSLKYMISRISNSIIIQIKLIIRKLLKR